MATIRQKLPEQIRFGSRMSERRMKSNLSQAELAEMIDKSSNAVSRYENAECAMDIFTFVKLANSLEVSPYELLDDLTEPKTGNSEWNQLLFQVNRLSKKDQRTVIRTMKAMVESLSEGGRC